MDVLETLKPVGIVATTLEGFHITICDNKVEGVVTGGGFLAVFDELLWTITDVEFDEYLRWFQIVHARKNKSFCTNEDRATIKMVRFIIRIECDRVMILDECGRPLVYNRTWLQ